MRSVVLLYVALVDGANPRTTGGCSCNLDHRVKLLFVHVAIGLLISLCEAILQEMVELLVFVQVPRFGGSDDEGLEIVR